MTTQLIRVVIVDDIAESREDLYYSLSHFTGLDVIAIAENVDEAVQIIPAIQPDLLFLDVELKDGTGFDILERLMPLSFKVIFVTAFERYAIKAIKFGALDYLLKPVDNDELTMSISKIGRSLPVSQEQIQFTREHLRSKDGPRKIILRSDHQLHIIQISDILYLQSKDGETCFNTLDGRCISVHKTIAEFERDFFTNNQFIRTHQSFLVNVDHITGYHFAGRLILQNGIELPVANLRRDFVQSWIKQTR